MFRHGAILSRHQASRDYRHAPALAFALCLPFAPVTRAALPPDNAYVQVSPDGHLQLDGQRVRYWGWIGHFWLEGDLKTNYALQPNDSPAEKAKKTKKAQEVFDALAQRIHDTGFNMVRIWNTCDWSKPYTVGDGSESDLLAFSINALNKRGIKVWMTAFNDLGELQPDDATMINDPTTANAWQEAVGQLAKKGLRSARQIAWDERSQAVALRRMKLIADWPNHYKGGIRLGDDPQMAVWELSNEEWWFTAMVNGDWQGLPKFFRDQLQAKWIAFLKEKYQNDAALKQAWMFLLPDESIAKGTVLIAPLARASDGKAMNDANPAALATLTARQQAVSRDDFNRQRAADVLEFMLNTEIAYKSKFRDAAKKMGKSLALSPMLMDTGDGFRIQSIALHQQGDAVAMCTYLWQVASDKQQPRFPFVSGLDEQPRLAMGTPWAEVGRVPGKPFFIYEFQTNNPDKYRAEVPFRIATLGIIQDWDIINFHLFGRPNDPAEATPYDKQLNLSHKDTAIEGVHFKNDMVETAAMKTAGAMFIHSTVKPVTNPTVMTFGKRSLYDPVSADYGKSFGDLGPKIAPTAHRFGLYMKVDPTQDGDTVVGPVVERGLNEACPIRPTTEIEYDWMKGHLKLDSPATAAYTGFFAQHGGPVRFAQSGIVLDQVQINNQEGLNYPVDKNELYVSFAAVAEDGKPLASSRKVIISLVSTAMNYGFKLDHSQVGIGDLGYTGKPFTNQTWGGDVKGKPPVAYAIPGCVLTVPPLNGMNFRVLDWHMRELAKGRITNGTLRIPNQKPIFCIELTR